MWAASWKCDKMTSPFKDYGDIVTHKSIPNEDHCGAPQGLVLGYILEPGLGYSILVTLVRC